MLCLPFPNLSPGQIYLACKYDCKVLALTTLSLLIFPRISLLFFTAELVSCFTFQWLFKTKCKSAASLRMQESCKSVASLWFNVLGISVNNIQVIHVFMISKALLVYVLWYFCMRATDFCSMNKQKTHKANKLAEITTWNKMSLHTSCVCRCLLASKARRAFNPSPQRARTWLPAPAPMSSTCPAWEDFPSFVGFFTVLGMVAECFRCLFWFAVSLARSSHLSQCVHLQFFWSLTHGVAFVYWH